MDRGQRSHAYFFVPDVFQAINLTLNFLKMFKIVGKRLFSTSAPKSSKTPLLLLLGGAGGGIGYYLYNQSKVASSSVPIVEKEIDYHAVAEGKKFIDFYSTIRCCKHFGKR